MYCRDTLAFHPASLSTRLTKKPLVLASLAALPDAAVVKISSGCNTLSAWRVRGRLPPEVREVHLPTPFLYPAALSTLVYRNDILLKCSKQLERRWCNGNFFFLLAVRSTLALHLPRHCCSRSFNDCFNYSCFVDRLFLSLLVAPSCFFRFFCFFSCSGLVSSALSSLLVYFRLGTLL